VKRAASSRNDSLLNIYTLRSLSFIGGQATTTSHCHVTLRSNACMLHACIDHHEQRVKHHILFGPSLCDRLLSNTLVNQPCKRILLLSRLFLRRGFHTEEIRFLNKKRFDQGTKCYNPFLFSIQFTHYFAIILFYRNFLLFSTYSFVVFRGSATTGAMKLRQDTHIPTSRSSSH